MNYCVILHFSFAVLIFVFFKFDLSDHYNIGNKSTFWGKCHLYDNSIERNWWKYFEIYATIYLYAKKLSYTTNFKFNCFSHTCVIHNPIVILSWQTRTSHTIAYEFLCSILIHIVSNVTPEPLGRNFDIKCMRKDYWTFFQKAFLGLRGCCCCCFLTISTVSMKTIQKQSFPRSLPCVIFFKWFSLVSP